MIKCVLEKGQLRKILAAKNRVYKELYQAVTSDQTGLLRELSDDYVREVRESIVFQKFAAQYQPYSKKYKNWKNKRLGHLRYWVFTGSTLANLMSWRIKGGKASIIGSGLQKNDASTQSGYGDRRFKMTKGTWYARIMEYGLGIVSSGYTIPGRSVFEATWWKEGPKFVKKIGDYFFGLGPKVWR